MHCIFCGEEADHSHKGDYACCGGCCALWGGLTVESEHAYRWVEERILPRIKELETALRREWWLNHGHTGMYGDDGEMQCSMCAKYGLWDFKRTPFDELAKHVQFVRLKH